MDVRSVKILSKYSTTSPNVVNPAPSISARSIVMNGDALSAPRNRESVTTISPCASGCSQFARRRSRAQRRRVRPEIVARTLGEPAGVSTQVHRTERSHSWGASLEYTRAVSRLGWANKREWRISRVPLERLAIESRLPGPSLSFSALCSSYPYSNLACGCYCYNAWRLETY